MISYINGKIKNKGTAYVIVLVGGLGYKVYINEALYSETNVGQEVEFYIFQNVREDALDLYGFASLEQLELFELLLSVSGIGPKSALGVLSAGKVADIKETIARGDSSLLIKVSGIGKKTAERVVLELREKVGSLASRGIGAGGAQSFSASSDEIDALVALGYSVFQAREALAKVDPRISNSGERIKSALRNI
jgi:Holliday junction DNA helicase RuvA